jgi:hypothetical protein
MYFIIFKQSFHKKDPTKYKKYKLLKKISFFKKLPLFIFLLLSISFELYSQEYGDYFGNYFSGFKYFKYKGLYAKLDLEQGGPELKNKVFVSIPKNIKDFDLLAGDLSKYENRVFKIDSIFDFKEDKDVGESKIFRLKEISTNTEIYYIYDIYARESHYLLTEFGKGDFDSYEEKEIFKTAREINQFAIVKQAGQRQKFIDQGQSVNLFFSANSSAKYVHEVHLSVSYSGIRSKQFQLWLHLLHIQELNPNQ